jgi:putative MATE family efflux protein
MTKNLTIGHPALLILSFTIPLLIGNLFQQFYNMADAFIVGRTLGVAALAAVGCTGSINFFLLGFVFGFTQGSSIITSQRFGAGDEDGVRRSFAVSILLGIGITLVLTIVGLIVARPFLVLLRTPPEIIDRAYDYIIIIYWGIGAIVLFNLVSNVMRAVGDSRTPLIFLVIACLINIVLDYVFILVFHAGVGGAALATVIAQIVAGLACIPVINKKLVILRLRREDWKISRAEIQAHLRVALPMGFQMSIIAIGILGMHFALNTLGTMAVAAFTAAQKIEAIAHMFLNSVGAALTTYVAQNYGARKIDRIRQGIVQCLVMAGLFSIVIGILFSFVGHRLAAFFIGGDSEVSAMAHTYLQINGLSYALLAVLLIFRQSLQGLGNSLIPTVAGAMELVMRLFAAIILSRFFGFIGLCFASPLAWLGAVIPLSIAIFSEMKRLNRQAFVERK